MRANHFATVFIKFYALGLLGLLILSSCGENKEKSLPFLGNSYVENGKNVYHSVREFTYTDQDSNVVDNTFLSDYIYAADFFFTSCPSICPTVKKQMLTIHEAFKDEPRFKLVSFTLDPKRDDVRRLKLYSSNIDVGAPQWHFVTGDKDFTLDLADDFFIAALEDDDAPGGFDHSGKIVLVDRDGHVRSFCEGTDPSTIPKFLEDIKILLKEQFGDE
jgi:protein SCO1